ncbi:MAG: 23S rRNA (guanosine(2251)-2'-O)-methyltransferase RlmB [Rhodothermales bacterium]
MADHRNEEASLLLGRNPVREAIERSPRNIEKVMIQQEGGGQDLADIRRLASDAGLQVQFVPEGRLNQLARGLNHQGVAAYAAPVAYVDVNEMLESIAPTREDVTKRKPRILVLDEIQDPFNFGAILRTAVASGTDGVIVPQRNMAPLNAAAMKASAGTANRIAIARVANVGDTIYQLKERGYWVAGAAASGDVSVWDMDWDRPVAVVIGSEGKGIRHRILTECDYRVTIPMAGPAESLNASVAAGILLFAAGRHRSGA